MRWILTWFITTISFIIISFFLPVAYLFPFLWMTIGMAIVAILFYFVTIKNNPNNINGNLLAIGLKFIFSALVFIIYIVAFKSKSNIDYYFFILAYVVYSIISYAGAYFYKKSISTK